MEPRPESRRALAAALFACLLIPLALYAPSLRAPFVFDDIPRIVENPGLGSLHPGPFLRGEGRNDPSRPLTYWSFALNFRLGKNEPFGYRLANVLLHGLCAAFLLLLARALLARLGEASVLGAAAAGLLFAAHPAHANAVAYVFSRSDLLAALFFLLSLWAFAAYAGGRRACAPLSLAAFALALASKQSAVVLPAAALLCDAVFLSNGELRGPLARWRYHASAWALALAYVLGRRALLGGWGDLEAVSTLPRGPYALSQPYALLAYLRMHLWPSGFCFDHFLKPWDSWLDAHVLFPVLALAGALALCAFALGRAAATGRVAAFAFLWFLLAFSPTSSLLPTASVLVENRLYLAGAGFFIFWGFCAARLARRAAPRGAAAGALGALLLLGAVTLGRARVYGNPTLLWEEAARRYPDNSRAHNNLGNAYRRKGEGEKALAAYARAAALTPHFADAHRNLGALRAQRGEYRAALEAFRLAARLKPEDAQLHYNLGVVSARLGERQEARKAYEKALRLKPDYAEACHNLGILLYSLKDYAGAEALFLRASRLSPSAPQPHFQLGELYEARKRPGAALEAYRRAQALAPGNPRIAERILRLER